MNKVKEVIFSLIHTRYCTFVDDTGNISVLNWTINLACKQNKVESKSLYS